MAAQTESLVTVPAVDGGPLHGMGARQTHVAARYAVTEQSPTAKVAVVSCDEPNVCLQMYLSTVVPPFHRRLTCHVRRSGPAVQH